MYLPSAKVFRHLKNRRWKKSEAEKKFLLQSLYYDQEKVILFSYNL
jgi:hypothetical protein